MKCFKCYRECYDECDNSCGSSYCENCKENFFNFDGIYGLGHNPLCGNLCTNCCREHVATQTCKECLEDFCKECYTICIDQYIKCFQCLMKMATLDVWKKY